jgi:probable addiction module antidote protein
MGKQTESYDDIMADDLRNDEYAIAYLNDALMDSEEPRLFLLALRRVAKARGVTMTEISDSLHLERRGLYKIFSEEGNPRWDTLTRILVFLGFNLQLSLRKS